MDTNNRALPQPAAFESDSWIDQRIAVLAPSEAWQPNVASGQSLLRKQVNAARSRGPRHWSWVTVFAAVAAAVIVAFALTAAPTPRVLAQRCVDCSIAIWQSISPAAPAQQNLTPTDKRVPAPDFTLTDAEGKSIRLSDAKGKVVLVNFWATWCGGCQVEIPWFRDLYATYKSAGLDAIGISMDDDGWTSVRPYLKEKPIPYTIVIGNESTAKLFKVSAMPVTILIDRQGEIAVTHTGLVTKSTYESEIQSLLK
jgi:peroxiredoxin